MHLDTNNHSVFKLNYHLIMVVKYRKKVIDDTISTRLKNMFEDIGAKYHIAVQEWNHDVDHVHVLMTAKPNSELSKFLNAYKSASSRKIKNEFPQIRKKLWKEYFWSQSYCLLTVGGAPLEVLKQYIETQGEKKGV
ncbi:IS200/IS605 family transposase [Robertmurraya sp. GLU-23]